MAESRGHKETPIAVFWFRRDLRLEDNTGLNEAFAKGMPVLALFIFDSEITGELPHDDARISFIHATLARMNETLRSRGSSILVKQGKPLEVWKDLIQEFDIREVCVNRDYEPYARDRDRKIGNLLQENGIGFQSFKDQVIYHEDEILKPDGKPYSVYTPYSKRWLELYRSHPSMPWELPRNASFLSFFEPFPALESLGFSPSGISVQPYTLDILEEYIDKRDLPFLEGTSRLSPHLRFGTVSIRSLAAEAEQRSETFLKELIWREFFMQILYHHPRVVTENYQKKYDGIAWRNNEDEFDLWRQGKTGFPMVDAGMRQLDQTGFMHNRVRMVCASFLCKHLLVDWRWGEAWFASKLLDYELSSNNGNWQWAAGTGCDAAPYFRVFNPTSQQEKFDPGMKYTRRWVPEVGSAAYPAPVVDHRMARERAIRTYKESLSQE